MREAARAVLRRGWLILVAGILGGAAMAAVVLAQPPEYQASAVVSYGKDLDTKEVLSLAASQKVLDRVSSNIAKIDDSTMTIDGAWMQSSTVSAAELGEVSLVVREKSAAGAIALATFWADALVEAVKEARHLASPEQVAALPASVEPVDNRLAPRVATGIMFGVLVGLAGVALSGSPKLEVS